MLKTRKEKKLLVSKSTQLLNVLNLAFESKKIDQVKKVEKRYKLDILIDALNESTNPEMIIFVLMITNEETTRILFRNLSENMQRQILDISSNNQAKIIITSLFPDEVVDLIKENDEHLKKKILLSLNSSLRNQIKEIAEYDEDEAGSLMNPEFLAFEDTMTIKECLISFKRNYDSLENDTSFYVINANKVLLGKVTLHDLIFSEQYNNKITSIMDENVMYVNPNDDIEKIIEMFQECYLDLLPVINENQELVGVINYSDILPALEDEVTEDIYNMYGIKELKESYMKSSVLSIVKSRIFWIVVLMISATLTSIVINQFEVLGEQLTAGVSSILLVPIVPVITGTSGNAGSQSVASVIRALSIGDVTKKEYKNVIKKEFLVGTTLGAILMVVNFVRLLIFFAIPAFRQIDTAKIKYEPYVVCVICSVAVSLALWVAIILSKTLGAILPLIAYRLGKDPTVMSAPLIATILDVCSTSILFGIGIGVLYPIIQTGVAV